VRRLIVIAVVSGTMAVAPTAASRPTLTASAPQGRIAYAPRVYPKDQRIVDNWEIYTVNAAGGRSLNLTRHPCDDGAPAWSHDGRSIAFVCSNSRGARLVVMQRDTRARRTALRLRAMGDLAWSPDDRQLAFAGYRGIRVVNADGTGLRTLSRGQDSSPTWSADGKAIAFSREVRSEVFDVLRMRADGTGQRRIASNAEAPAFSPDGRSIAFLRGLGSIWLMDADGARQRRLPLAGDGHFDLAWSPDGRYLAFQHQHYELYVIALDGTRRRLLPTYGADISGMDWGPNPR
jgi:Tol biopolymer transport system component